MQAIPRAFGELENGLVCIFSAWCLMVHILEIWGKGVQLEGVEEHVARDQTERLSGRKIIVSYAYLQHISHILQELEGVE